jgi:hypothetical protein
MSPAKLLFAGMVGIASALPASGDSLVVIPARPTITDSIQVGIIFKDEPSCLYNFSQTSPAVSFFDDSDINLGVALTVKQPFVKDTLCTEVAVLTYRMGTLPAGTYSVYETVDYVNGALLAGSLIGHFTVIPATSVTVLHRRPLLQAGTSPEGRVYNVRGALVSSFSAAGARRVPGVYLVKSGEKAATSARVLYVAK